MTSRRFVTIVMATLIGGLVGVLSSEVILGGSGERVLPYLVVALGTMTLILAVALVVTFRRRRRTSRRL
jgi:hypothetical protein